MKLNGGNGNETDCTLLKPLPVGIQTFGDIIRGGFVYVDKTRWIYALVRYPKGVYFLSRPRRFGKSLLLSILEAIFRGRRELFAGLWLDESDYAREEHPVVRVVYQWIRKEGPADMPLVFRVPREEDVQAILRVNGGENHA